jgi:hypothetical protein
MCKRTGMYRRTPAPMQARINRGCWWSSSLAGAAMNRFAHRLVMSGLLVAALVLIWNVLGSR